jgi:hypothetical protein
MAGQESRDSRQCLLKFSGLHKALGLSDHSFTCLAPKLLLCRRFLGDLCGSHWSKSRVLGFTHPIIPCFFIIITLYFCLLIVMFVVVSCLLCRHHCARSCLLLALVVMLVSFGMLVCVYFTTTVTHDPYFTHMSFLLVYSHILHK